MFSPDEDEDLSLSIIHVKDTIERTISLIQWHLVICWTLIRLEPLLFFRILLYFTSLLNHGSNSTKKRTNTITTTTTKQAPPLPLD